MRIAFMWVCAILSFPIEAHADAATTIVSGSAIVGGTATVSGNAFSVGGSTFVAKEGRIGVRTSSPVTDLDVSGGAQFGEGPMISTLTALPGGSTYALGLSSGMKLLNGGPIELTPGGYIKWADGSVSKYRYGHSVPVAFSSQAVSGSVSQSSFKLCQTTASIAIVGSDSRIRVTFNGATFGGGAIVSLNVLLDGRTLEGYSSGVGIVTTTDSGPTGGYQIPESFSVLSDVVSSGPHYVCISMVTGFGYTRTFQNDSNASSHLLLEEVP